jgi:hypothetical protein
MSDFLPVLSSRTRGVTGSKDIIQLAVQAVFQGEREFSILLKANRGAHWYPLYELDKCDSRDEAIALAKKHHQDMVQRGVKVGVLPYLRRQKV